MEKINQLSEEDTKKLLELYNRAQNTPVIAMSLEDGLRGRDFASLAWNELRDFQKELGNKYRYDWNRAAVNQKGEVFAIA